MLLPENLQIRERPKEGCLSTSTYGENQFLIFVSEPPLPSSAVGMCAGIVGQESGAGCCPSCSHRAEPEPLALPVCFLGGTACK